MSKTEPTQKEAKEFLRYSFYNCPYPQTIILPMSYHEPLERAIKEWKKKRPNDFMGVNKREGETDRTYLILGY